MDLKLSIDRVEDGAKGEALAVLLLEDGRTFSLPRDLLPKGVKAGDSLTMALARDPKADADLARQARAIRDRARNSDPGGDVRL